MCSVYSVGFLSLFLESTCVLMEGLIVSGTRYWGLFVAFIFPMAGADLSCCGTLVRNFVFLVSSFDDFRVKRHRFVMPRNNLF